MNVKDDFPAFTPASAGVKAEKSPLPGGRCDLIWHVISRSGVVISITNCYIRFTYLRQTTDRQTDDRRTGDDI